MAKLLGLASQGQEMYCHRIAVWSNLGCIVLLSKPYVNKYIQNN